jgi:hypothetical protein
MSRVATKQRGRPSSKRVRDEGVLNCVVVVIHILSLGDQRLPIQSDANVEELEARIAALIDTLDARNLTVDELTNERDSLVQVCVCV